MHHRSTIFPSSARWSSWWVVVLFIGGGPLLSSRSSSSSRHLVEAQTGGFPSCSICPNITPMVGLPGLILPQGTVGITAEGTTCGQFEADAKAGMYSPAVCAIIRLSVAQTCGCIGAVPTSAPITAAVPTPTMAPVPAPTGAPVTTVPTTAPVPAPTTAPVTAVPTTTPVTVAPTVAPITVAAPTTAPITVAAPTTAPITVAPTTAPATVAPPTVAPAAIVIVPTAAPIVNGTTTSSPTTAMPASSNVTTPTIPAPPTTAPVAAPPTEAPVLAAPTPLIANIVVNIALGGRLEGNDTVAFNKGCTTFLVGQLADDLDNVTCTYVNQSSSLAIPQDEILVQVTGVPSGDSDEIVTTAALEGAAIEAVNDNPGGFVTEIQSACDSDFCDNLTGSSVSAESVNPPPAPAPPVAQDDDDNGLSPGGIAGIVIATVIGIAVVGLIVMRLNGSKGDEDKNRRQPYSEIEEHGEEEENESVMIHPPPDPLVFPPDAPKASVASRAAVQAAASGAGSVLSASSLAHEEAAESEMEGYSVKAGGSTTVDNPGSVADVASAVSGALSSLRPNMIARTVLIPAGKLGIVVDTTLEGPVVNRVNEGSPVEGILFPGDIIVAVDDIDTRAMSASAIYSLMKKTSDMRRVITVLSEDVSA